MHQFTPYSALIGGALIGFSAALLLWTNGRIAGISGIFNGGLDSKAGDKAWRWWFLAGLVTGAGIYTRFFPLAFETRNNFPLWLLILAGCLVGVGARMGSGCTSGHGICGIARLSSRSILATLMFLGTGMLTVFLIKHIITG